MELNNKSFADEYVRYCCTMLSFKMNFYLESLENAKKSIQEIQKEIIEYVPDNEITQ